MKTAIIACVISGGLVLGSLAFGDDGKAAAQTSLTKPESLSSQVIDTGKDADKDAGKEASDTSSNGKSGDDDVKRVVPHFAGHAFAE